MRKRAVSAAGLLCLALLTVPGFGAEPQYSPPKEEHPVELSVGEIFKVCPTGLVICPATGPICDDPTVAIPVNTSDGVAFKAVGPGTTLCSVMPPGGRYGSPRALFRITVR